MDYQKVVEGWLAEASLPGRLPRRFAPNGQWTVNVGGTTMTMAVDSVREKLFFAATLFRLDGDEPAEFLRRLLVLQSEPIFPTGFTLTLDTESETLILFGRFDLNVMNAKALNTLLNDTIASIARLVDKILTERRAVEVFEEVMAEEMPAAVPTTASAQPLASNASHAPESGEINYDELSDEELLRLQIMQSMRV